MRSDLYKNMMHSESVAIRFKNNDEAEDYVWSNPDAIAIVIEDGVVISTFYGADYGFSE